MTDLVFEPLYVVSEHVRAGRLSPVDVTQACLRQIELHGERLNPFITLTADLALAMARETEREIVAGTYRGPLHGIPLVLKDLLDTRGVRTTGGSRLFMERVPDEDATVVRLLREAGAVFLGKTGMPEFAVHPTSTNPVFGAVRNPWNPTYDTAGSSSGTAAALAAGMAYGGPGSDTGGSIRMPSAACGLVGLKPTWGRVSLRGVLPLCALHDHVGPMARTVRDAALLLDAMTRYDPNDPYSRADSSGASPVDSDQMETGLRGLRVAYLTDDGGGPVEEEISDAVRAGVLTLERAGAGVDEMVIPILGTLWYDDDMIPPLEESETAHDYGFWLHERPDDLTEGFRDFVERGLRRTGPEVMQARRNLSNVLYQVERALEGFDLLLTPTLGMFPPPTGEERLELLRFTNPWNANGWPAISVPVGLSSEGLPIGMQIIARPWQEALLLRAARVIEQAHALSWPPPL